MSKIILQEDGWPQEKVGGWWRLGRTDGNERAGRERRERFDGKDDRENQKSQVGFRSTLTEESVKVQDRSGGLVARPRFNSRGAGGTKRALHPFEDSLFLEKLTIFGRPLTL